MRSLVRSNWPAESVGTLSASTVKSRRPRTPARTRCHDLRERFSATKLGTVFGTVGCRKHSKNMAWAMDITYIPRARGFVYLAAVVDWFSRVILAWKLSNTMETSFWIEALEEALSRNATPEICNTDQGSQFTSEAFNGRLKENGIAISRDGRGRWRDNVFVERVWKSIKYEEVYLHAYDSVHQARTSIGKYIEFYNSICPHSSLKALTPDQVYFNRRPESLAA